MKIENRSRYSDDEVRHIVTEAARGINTARVLVIVKNASTTARYGYYHHGMPLKVIDRACQGFDRYVELFIGPRSMYPNCTGRWNWRFRPITDEEMGRLTPEQAKNVRQNWDDKRGSYAEIGVVNWEGYGGKRSPVLDLATWQEGLFSLAAHEFRHHWQAQRGKRANETECETFAGARLEAWRNR